TGAAVAASGHFAVNILGEDHPDLALHFASKAGDKFASVAATPGTRGAPLLDEALATLECRVTDETKGGTHTVFLAEEDRASARPAAPLAYFRGGFGRLQLDEDESAYAVLKRRTRACDLPTGEPLALDRPAADIAPPRGAVYNARARLYGETL